MIKVLVVDDLPVVREFISHILQSDPGIQVIGTAANGAEAIVAVKEQRPDVVTMDVHMPKMDGLEATRLIMETTPVPIIIVSGSFEPREVSMSFRAVEAGAVAFVARPAGPGHPDHAKTVTELLQNVKAMAGVRVVRRWRPSARQDQSRPLPGETAPPETAPIGLVAIGASTGGPVVIQQILASLPRDFAAPLMIVQHMAKGFTGGFVDWLAQSSAMSVKLAIHGEPLHPGCAYVAPDGFNMVVENEGRIALRTGDHTCGHCPSVSQLFGSVARVYGRNAVGILLTGMGKDGAKELLAMKEQGAVTMAQDEISSIVYGMPGVAYQLNAATYILPPAAIIDVVKKLVLARQRNGGKGTLPVYEGGMKHERLQPRK